MEQSCKRAVAEHFDIGFGDRARKTAVSVWLHFSPDSTDERLARTNFESRLPLCEVVKEHLTVESLAEFFFCHNRYFDSATKVKPLSATSGQRGEHQCMIKINFAI